MMCILFGLFGGHYFYVGRIFRGLIALFTLDFFLIGWVLDIGTIMRGRFKDQYGDYLKE